MLSRFDLCCCLSKIHFSCSQPDMASESPGNPISSQHVFCVWKIGTNMIRIIASCHTHHWQGVNIVPAADYPNFSFVMTSTSNSAKETATSDSQVRNSRRVCAHLAIGSHQHWWIRIIELSCLRHSTTSVFNSCRAWSHLGQPNHDYFGLL